MVAVDSLQALALSLLVPNPWQPRRNMDADELATLAASIREQGLLQPIVVQPLEGSRYVIVAGH